METTRNFGSILFFLSLTLALMGCDGTGGDPDPHDSYQDDVVGQDQSNGDQNDPDLTHPDTIGQDQNQPDVTTVCDEDNVCCTGSTCCKNGACWLVMPDVVEETTDGNDADAEPECYTKDQCEDGQICTLDTQKCLPETVLEPYLFLEGDWKCLEGCEPLYEIFPLTLNGYEENTDTILAKGLVEETLLKFHVGAEGLSLLSATNIMGDEWDNHTFNNNEQTISFERYEEGWGTTHWLFKLQPK